MLISNAVRCGVTLLLVFPMACRTADQGDAQADTAGPSAESIRPRAATVPAARDTKTLSHPHAGARPALVVGPATIVVDSTSWAQVQAALGVPSIAGDTTGNERQIHACYVAGAGSDRVTVRLSVLGNVDDENATMQQALAVLRPTSAAIARGDVISAGPSTPKRCAPLSVPPAEIRWVGGLRLGMTRSEVERLLGAPSDSKHGEWVYGYDDPNVHEVVVDSATRKEIPWSVHVSVGVQVRYDQDVATRIEAWYWKEYYRL